MARRTWTESDVVYHLVDNTTPDAVVVVDDEPSTGPCHRCGQESQADIEWVNVRVREWEGQTVDLPGVVAVGQCLGCNGQ